MALASGLLALGLGGAAFAQQAPGPPPGCCGGMMMGGHCAGAGPGACGAMGRVTVEETPDGAVIRMSGRNRDEVRRIQRHAERMRDCAAAPSRPPE